MTITVPASEVGKSFDDYLDRALQAPVLVTKEGREAAYIISAETFRSLKRSQRTSLAAAELSDEEMALIDTAAIPDEERYDSNEDSD